MARVPVLPQHRPQLQQDASVENRLFPSPSRLSPCPFAKRRLENARFCGTLASGTAVNQWLDDIDLYIQPSLTEGLPRALIEAMSRGCPALGSGAGGIPELLAPECIHKPGDSATLAKMLETAIQDKDWQKSQAARNFREAAAYDSKVLDDIRREFWLDFAGYCRTQKALQEDGTRVSAISG